MELQFSESKKIFILLAFTKELINNSGNGEFFKLEKVIKEELTQQKNNKLLDLEDIFKEQSKYSEKRLLPDLEILPAQPIISKEKEVSKIESLPKEKSIISKEKEVSKIESLPEEKSIISKERKRLTKTIEIDSLERPMENLRDVLESGRSNRSPLAVQSMRKGRIPVLKIPNQTLPPRFGYLKPIPTKREIDLGPLNALVRDPLVKNIECNGAGKNIIVEGSMGRKETNTVLDRREIDEIIDAFSKAAKIPISEGVFRVVFGKFTFSAIISELIGSKFIIRKTVYTPHFQNN